MWDDDSISRREARNRMAQEMQDEALATQARKRAEWQALPGYARTQVYLGGACLVLLIPVVLLAGEIQYRAHDGGLPKAVALLPMIALATAIFVLLDFAARGLLPRWLPLLRHRPINLRARFFQVRLAIYLVLGVLLSVAWLL